MYVMVTPVSVLVSWKRLSIRNSGISSARNGTICTTRTTRMSARRP